MATQNKIIERLDYLLDLANKTIIAKSSPGAPNYNDSSILESEFRTSSLSLIKKLYGETHPFYTDFNSFVNGGIYSSIQSGIGILLAIKSEIEGGWLNSFRGLVSAEIFADFLEMADYLLKENYKDAAAVMIGSVLEEHLRQLCGKHGIPVEDLKSGKPVPKKADLLNSELGSAGIYNKLDQKSVTSWLDLRNKAAHGKYSEYSQQQVEIMLQGVTEFMTRNSI